MIGAEERIANALAFIDEYNAALDDDSPPRGAIPPDGDDFNEICAVVRLLLGGGKPPVIHLAHRSR